MLNKKTNHQKKCVLCGRKTSWVDMWSSSVLMFFKLAVGFLTGSRALIASSVYSLNDILSSIAVILGLKLSEKPVDEEYPYGYGNIEYVVSIFTGVVLLIFSIVIFYESINVIFHGEHARIHWAASVAALVSIFINEILYKYDLCVVKHINSPAISSQAQHHQADTISSVVVFFGLQLDRFGYYHLDALVAVFETLHIAYLGVEMLYHGSMSLMEHSINKHKVNSIKTLVSRIPDVQEVKNIKARQIGRDIWVDLYISVAGGKKIDETDEISVNIRNILSDSIKYLGNVHIIFV